MVIDQCDFNLYAISDGLSDENYIYVQMVIFFRIYMMFTLQKFYCIFW